jgi:dihydroorotase
MTTLIKNVKVIDAYTSYYGDIVIKNGLFTTLAKDESLDDIQVIDGKGLTAMPAFTDTHAHFREPGFEYKETIETGSRAAVRGGYTSVLLMGNTNPSCSRYEIINEIQEKAKQIGLVDIIQSGTITSGIEGKDISHLSDVRRATQFITDDGKGVMNDKIMLEAMYFASKHDMTVISHAENHYFSDTNMRLAENLMTFRDIELCRISGCRLHMAHVSTKEALKRILEAKEEGLNITYEITPHHIYADSSTHYRVNPPFREKEDVAALIDAIKSGKADAIGTDHAPHSLEDKAKGAPGISGIELSFSICYTVLVKNNTLSLNQLSSILSEKPSKILGIKKGLIKEGYQGDLVLVDTEAEYKINANQLVSKGKNTPFEGQKVYGNVLMTIKSGNIVYKGEEYDCR